MSTRTRKPENTDTIHNVGTFGKTEYVLRRIKDDDNLIRVKSRDAAQELLEITFG